MKKIYSKLLMGIILFAIAILFIFCEKTNAANTIHKINMDVYINPEGVAEITEVWEATLTQGTEGYKPYANLGNCKITNFSVRDDSGVTYTKLSNWDSNKSFDSKIHKCGVINKSDGIESLWGTFPDACVGCSLFMLGD